jgi:Fur family ferric uptake transcriptional regulator
LNTKRNTIARSQIFDLISTSKSALSHAEIQAQLDNICNRVTIYRVLDRLVEEGLVHKAVTTQGEVKFAVTHQNSADNNHIHFSCEICNAVLCIDNAALDFSLPEGYQINQMSFSVSGVCPKCNH